MRHVLASALLAILCLVQGLHTPVQLPTAVQHKGAVLSLASCSVEGTIVLVSGSHDKSMRFWNLQEHDLTPQPIGSVQSLPGSVFSLTDATALRGTEQLLSDGGIEREVRLWQLKWRRPNKLSATCTAVLGSHTGWVRALLCAQSAVFSVGCNYIKMWRSSSSSGGGSNNGSSSSSSSSTNSRSSGSKADSVSELQHFCDLEVRGDILALASAPAPASMLFAATVDGRIHSWKLQPALQASINSNSRVAAALPLKLAAPEYCGSVQGHRDRITAMACRLVKGADSPEQQLCSSSRLELYSAGHDCCVKVWRITSTSARPLLQLQSECCLAAAHSNNRVLSLVIVPESSALTSTTTKLLCGMSDGSVVQLAVAADSSAVTVKRWQHRHSAAVLALTCIDRVDGSVTAVSGAADGSLACWSVV
jgi:WD40 repeat protein